MSPEISGYQPEKQQVPDFIEKKTPDPYFDLLSKLSTLKRKETEALQKIQEISDEKFLTSHSSKEEEMKKEADRDAREELIEQWLLKEVPKQKEELTEEFDSAGYKPWKDGNDELHFFIKEPKDIHTLSKEDFLKTFKSWKNADEEMQRSMDILMARNTEMENEKWQKKSVFESEGIGISPKDKAIPITEEKKNERLSHDYAVKYQRIQMDQKLMKERIQHLLTIANKFGYISRPSASGKSIEIVKKETVQ